MGRLCVNMFTTLDGVMQAPGAPEEDRAGGFEYGGWQAPLLDEESGERMTRHIEGMDALLLGRKTYDIFAGYWPKAPSSDPIARKLNEMPKYVASRTLRRVEWSHASLLQGDVPQEVDRLKRKHAEVHTFGSADLIQTLMQHDLVDRFNLWLYPVVLGTGKRLFPPGSPPAAMRLLEARPFRKGAVMLTYERAGKPTVGDMTVVDAERAR